MGWKVTIGLIVVMIAYLVGGGYMFFAVENPSRANDSHISTLTSGVYFAATVITTVGYGHITVKSTLGQWLVVLYGVIGIPLNLVMLAAVGNRVRGLINSLISKIIERCSKSGISDKCRILISFLTLFFLGTFVFLIIPSLIFMETEDWTFTQGFYYSFSTVSTIGFGDLVAASSYKDESIDVSGVYQIMATIWMFTGLSWLSTIWFIVLQFYNTFVDKNEHDLIPGSSRESERQLVPTTDIYRR